MSTELQVAQVTREVVVAGADGTELVVAQVEQIVDIIPSGPSGPPGPPGAPGLGDMAKAVYDPRNIAADVFVITNQTGDLDLGEFL